MKAENRRRLRAPVFFQRRVLAAGAAISLLVIAPVATVAAADACDAPPVGFHVIKGTSGDDVLVGTPGKDVICGRGGSDIIFGGDGNDPSTVAMATTG
jgi:hypothetical protein